MFADQIVTPSSIADQSDTPCCEESALTIAAMSAFIAFPGGLEIVPLLLLAE